MCRITALRNSITGKAKRNYRNQGKRKGAVGKWVEMYDKLR
jgi:hypothetical protein